MISFVSSKLRAAGEAGETQFDVDAFRAQHAQSRHVLLAIVTKHVGQRSFVTVTGHGFSLLRLFLGRGGGAVFVLRRSFVRRRSFIARSFVSLYAEYRELGVNHHLALSRV